MCEPIQNHIKGLDLADNRRGALLDELPGLRGGTGEMPPHPFGAQLNRRQRILDLVGKTARDFAPGGDLLRANQRRDVFERVIDTSWGGVSSRLCDASSISAASGFSFGDPNTVDAS